jgi:hypothetical protein
MISMALLRLWVKDQIRGGEGAKVVEGKGTVERERRLRLG